MKLLQDLDWVLARFRRLSDAAVGLNNLCKKFKRKIN
jgi:hypothetical protein